MSVEQASQGTGPVGEGAGIQRSRAATSQGEISFREMGAGAPVVFVHGLIADGRLWDGTASRLGPGLRAILPDWPMGSHRIAMDPAADLSPPGLAAIVAELLEALDLHDVTIVGNDSGGAISQILAVNHPERIGRLVLTNCDSFEQFPPFPFSLMPPLARVPGGMAALAAPFRIGAIRRFTYSVLAAEPIDSGLTDSWLEPSMQVPAVRRDLQKVTAGLHKRHTLAAAEGLREFARPVLLAWGTEDRFFKPAQAERLAATIPNSRIEWISEARTFVSLDRPEHLAELIRSFVTS